MPFQNESIPLTSLTLPAGAVSGARIVLDGSTDTIKMFDAANHLVIEMDPSGIMAGNDLSTVAAANLVRMNVTDAVSSNPAFEIQPGNSFAGNWFPGAIETFLGANTGTTAEQQVVSISSPNNAANTNPQTFIDLWSGPWDNSGSANGQTSIKMFADVLHIDDSNGDLFFASDKAFLGGDFLINQGGLQITEGTNILGGNQRMGLATLVGGTVTVTNNTVTANTRIFLTCQVPGGTPGFLRISTRVANTSFTILSSSAADTSQVAYLMIEKN